MAEENQQQQQQQPHYDWSAFYDDEGRLYYYNSVTEESAWDPPEEGFHPPPAPPLVEHEHEQESQLHYDWSAHYDDEGRLYYYNAVTEESAWEPPPEGFNPPKENHPETKNDGDNENENKSAPADEMETESNADNNKDQEEVVASPAINKNDNKDDDAPFESSPLPSPSASSNPMDVEETETGTTEAIEKPTFDWTAHWDEEEGRLYYHNAVTDETTWDAPEEGFNPAPEAEEETTSDNTVKLASQDATDTSTTTTTTPWIAYTNEEGLEYYYNEETEITQWEKPEKYRQPSLEEQEEESAHRADGKGEGAAESDDRASLTKSPTTDDRGSDDSEGPDHEGKTVTQQLQQEEELQQKSPEIDPAVQLLRDAEAALNQTDSVLEPSCLDYIQIMAKATGNPAKAMSTVVENYYGQTAVCGLLARWMTQLTATRRSDPVAAHPKSTDNSSSTSATTVVAAAAINALGQTPAEVQADRIRDTVQHVISKIAKERFTKDKGDSILDLSKSEAAFLEDMMDSPRWRKLLIDLSAQHKDSAVLLYCLRAISKRGHHREIALRINPSDHFAVFNAMLLSELTVLGSVAVAAGVNVAAAASLTERMQTELRRACSTTAYTYVYVLQLLGRLDALARRDMAENTITDHLNDVKEEKHNDSQVRFRRAVRKWSALRELLESGMMDPTVSMSNAGSSHLFRKRQLDVALSVSDLYQNQKRRRRGIAVDNNIVKDPVSHDNLEKALATLLRRHAIGTQLDDTVLDNLLPSGLDLDTRGVGHLMVRHPLAIRALLGHLFQSGPSRITAASKKNKCARLVALAALAAQDLAKAEAIKLGTMTHDNSDRGDDSPDEVALTRMILQGSQLCEYLETMISFLVTTDQLGTSPGEKLCSLALQCPLVGLGVVIWARAFTAGADYAASASFPTLSSSILSLVRLVAMRYPFAREYALHVALAFLRHSNSDVSYVKVNLIKEHSLRLLLFLLIKGDVVPVFSNITARLQSNNSELDASLVRYFVAGVLEVVQPPVSPVFVRLFGGLLREPRAVDAVKSNYFAIINRKRLETMLRSFEQIRLYDGAPLGKDEQLLVSSLLSAYQVV